MKGIGRLRSLLDSQISQDDGLPPLTDEDRRYLTRLYDDSVPLPVEASELTSENPRLIELRDAYSRLDLPVLSLSRWNRSAVSSFLDLRWFRGETLFVWHYRELPRVSQLKYFVYARYVRDRDELGLLDRLTEDGLFGCWTYSFRGWGRVSRDLLQSINEISYLERQLKLSGQPSIKVLDIGAGYGRLGHRMAQALDNVSDYCCVDAVPEATFLSEWYLRYRGCSPPARVVSLDTLDEQLAPRTFDLAVNMHSFSECPLAAVSWWIDRLVELQVCRLLIIPNEPDALLSTEGDGSRVDFSPVLDEAGFELVHCEPVISDEAIAELLPLHDRFYLYERL